MGTVHTEESVQTNGQGAAARRAGGCNHSTPSVAAGGADGPKLPGATAIMPAQMKESGALGGDAHDVHTDVDSSVSSAMHDRSLRPVLVPVSRSGEELCSLLIEEIGEDPTRDGLARTPARFAKAMREMTSGYSQDIHKLVNGAIFEESYSEPVVVRDVEFYSLCEHHLLPFFGRVHVAYIPRGKIIGLSKIPRIIQMYARRLQVQERLTHEIADQLVELLEPEGVACMIEGAHMCMMMRGVQSQSGTMVTKCFRGVYQTNEAYRRDFLSLIDSKR